MTDTDQRLWREYLNAKKKLAEFDEINDVYKERTVERRNVLQKRVIAAWNEYAHLAARCPNCGHSLKLKGDAE